VAAREGALGVAWFLPLVSFPSVRCLVGQGLGSQDMSAPKSAMFPDRAACRLSAEGIANAGSDREPPSFARRHPNAEKGVRGWT
jgi:hypothetical protein